MAKPRTLYDKIWDSHLVHEAPDGTCLLYVDRHLIHDGSRRAFQPHMLPIGAVCILVKKLFQ